MKRRDFLLLAGVMSVSWTPAAAEVEIPRIGLIHAGSRQENQRLVGAFQDGLSALGWTDGNNIAVVDRWAEERTEALPAIVKELIGSGVAVLVTAGTRATLAAKRATPTIPIVLVAVDDPVSIGVRPRRSPNGWSCCASSSRVCIGSRSSSGMIPASTKSCRTSAARLSGRGSRH
jgi:putative ABC transport system substrate-binding protein